MNVRGSQLEYTHLLRSHMLTDACSRYPEANDTDLDVFVPIENLLVTIPIRN